MDMTPDVNSDLLLKSLIHKLILYAKIKLLSFVLKSRNLAT